MPGGDGTGPRGMGPVTGRGMGCCTGFYRPGDRGAFCSGRGRGFGRMYYVTGLPGRVRRGAYPYGFAPYAYRGAGPTPYDRESLRNQADFLERELIAVRERLDDIEESE